MINKGRQDSKLRPSANKALMSHGSALDFQAISNFLLGSAKFVVTNKVIFVRNLSAIIEKLTLNNSINILNII